MLYFQPSTESGWKRIGKGTVIVSNDLQMDTLAGRERRNLGKLAV